MKKLVIYVHGKGGNAEEANHYKSLFNDYDVIGFDYKAQTPWDAKLEFSNWYDLVSRNYDSVVLIANSVGAFFSMNALADKKLGKAYFISPIVNMEKLIQNMMMWINVTEDELRDKKEIETPFGETLSWEYLSYVRENPITWTIPTNILYGEKDNLTSYEAITEFAQKIHAPLTVMKNGEHWFHTKEQVDFMDKWFDSNCID